MREQSFPTAGEAVGLGGGGSGIGRNWDGKKGIKKAQATWLPGRGRGLRDWESRKF